MIIEHYEFQGTSKVKLIDVHKFELCLTSRYSKYLKNYRTIIYNQKQKNYVLNMFDFKLFFYKKS